LRAAEYAQKHNHASVGPHAPNWADERNDAADKVFTRYRKCTRYFTQNFGDHFLFDLTDSGQIEFHCSMCHNVRMDSLDGVIIHNCERADAVRDSHYTDNCVALICRDCRQDITNELLSACNYSCINCRRSRFHTLE